jgi:hypothetical protein
MALLCDYFTAANDHSAAATIDWTGGPANAPQAESGRVGGSASAEGYRSVPTPGIEPVVTMGTLESLLSGRSAYDVLDEHPGGLSEEVAVRDEGERLVYRISENLQRLLAAADASQLAETARPWSQTDEFLGQGDAEILGSLLQQLSGLAQRAVSNDEQVYCWLSV